MSTLPSQDELVFFADKVEEIAGWIEECKEITLNVRHKIGQLLSTPDGPGPLSRRYTSLLYPDGLPAHATPEERSKLRKPANPRLRDTLGSLQKLLGQAMRREIPPAELVSELRDKVAAIRGNATEVATVKHERPKVTANERMTAQMLKDPESKLWSAQKWADTLGCAKSTVIGTPAWAKLMKLRAMAKVERVASNGE